MPRTANRRKLGAAPLEPAAPCGFTLKLLLPDEKVVAIPMPEGEATLRIDPDDDPVFDLQSGTFHLQLNRVVFTGPGR